MIWVANGVRRKRDRAQFFASVDAAIVINREPPIVSVRWKEGALLRDWGASRVPVYFDFGEDMLWRLNPCSPNGMTYLLRVRKTVFLNAHLKGPFSEEMVSAKVERAAARYLMQQALMQQALMQQAPRSQPLVGFQRWLARQERKRPRF
jgi:competence protein CoiA